MYQPQTQLIDAVLAGINELDIFAAAIAGELREENSIAIQPSTGRDDSIYYNRGRLHTINLLILAKHDSQITAFDHLQRICTYLQCAKEYPDTQESYEWCKSQVSTYPTLVTLQEDGKYIYSAVIDITAYF